MQKKGPKASKNSFILLFLSLLGSLKADIGSSFLERGKLTDCLSQTFFMGTEQHVATLKSDYVFPRPTLIMYRKPYPGTCGPVDVPLACHWPSQYIKHTNVLLTLGSWPWVSALSGTHFPPELGKADSLTLRPQLKEYL